MDDLKYLKKHYGEKFAHLCRELFPTILDNKGLLSKLISDHFAPTHSLYQDIMETNNKYNFMLYIYSLTTVGKEEVLVEKEIRSPKELLDEAGYILYDECMTEEDIQAFKQYYATGEEICTFYDEHRLNNCRVWFAVKKNAADINHKFYPSREDEYGTSVISIQFTKGIKSILSIKNRYNDKVTNPDATFRNNLDNIIPGLTQAFVETYHIPLVYNGIEEFGLDPYVMDRDGKCYRYNLARNGIYYCENNVIIRYGEKIQLDKNRYTLAENYVIDQQGKTIKDYTVSLGLKESLVDSIGDIKNILITTSKEQKLVKFITQKGGRVELTLNEHNEIIGLINEDATEIGNRFLDMNEKCEWVDLPNVKKIGNRFLFSNKDLKRSNLSKVAIIGNDFLYWNKELKSITLSAIEVILDNFMAWNNKIEEVEISNASYIGNNCLSNASCLKSIDISNAEKIGGYFLKTCKSLKSADVRSATKVGQSLMKGACSLEDLTLSSVLKGVDHLKEYIERNNGVITYIDDLEEDEFSFQD